MPNGLYITRQYVSPLAQASGGGGGGSWTGTPVQTVSFGTNGGAGTSFVFTWSSTPLDGNTIWLSVASDTTISTPVGWILDPTVTNVVSQGQYIFYRIASSEASTVTINLAAGNISSSGCTVWGLEYAGLPASSLDKASLQGGSGSGTNCPITATATLSQAAELCLVSICWNHTAGPLTGHSFASLPFVYINQVVSTGSTTNIGQALGTLVVSATTGVGTTDTYTGTTTNGQGIIATYKHN